MKKIFFIVLFSLGMLFQSTAQEFQHTICQGIGYIDLFPKVPEINSGKSVIPKCRDYMFSADWNGYYIDDYNPDIFHYSSLQNLHYESIIAFGNEWYFIIKNGENYEWYSICESAFSNQVNPFGHRFISIDTRKYKLLQPGNPLDSR